ncbi:hypothetical protein GBO86_02190 [Pediococcus acidilactici]|nr:hypothetical protein GBO86_02190 [Pediococcus acidilactici]
MKFWGGLVVLTLLFNVKGVVLANERTNSEVGITFYQKTTANQVVPMQRIPQPSPNYLKRPPAKNPRFQFLPQTNEEIGLGLAWAGICLVCYVLVKKAYPKIFKRQGG